MFLTNPAFAWSWQFVIKQRSCEPKLILMIYIQSMMVPRWLHSNVGGEMNVLCWLILDKNIINLWKGSLIYELNISPKLEHIQIINWSWYYILQHNSMRRAMTPYTTSIIISHICLIFRPLSCVHNQLILSPCAWYFHFLPECHINISCFCSFC